MNIMCHCSDCVHFELCFSDDLTVWDDLICDDFVNKHMERGNNNEMERNYSGRTDSIAGN